MQIGFNTGDLTRITKKIERLKRNVEVRNSSPVFNVVLQYVNEYKQAVQVAMESVYGEDGGSPKLTYLGMSGNTHWEALSDYTMQIKKEKGLSLYIWTATGGTKSAVQVKIDQSAQTKAFFAGIDRASNPEAFRRAVDSEFGGVGQGLSGSVQQNWPSRPLFTIINQIFIDHHAKITEAVHRALMDGVNWGAS